MGRFSWAMMKRRAAFRRRSATPGVKSRNERYFQNRGRPRCGGGQLTARHGGRSGVAGRRRGARIFVRTAGFADLPVRSAHQLPPHIARSCLACRRPNRCRLWNGSATATGFPSSPDGTSASERVRAVRGTVANPMTREDIVAKAHDHCLLERILNLESITNVLDLRPLIQSV
jgi:hypothetical protein